MPGGAVQRLQLKHGEVLGAKVFEVSRNWNERGADRMRACRLAQATTLAGLVEMLAAE